MQALCCLDMQGQHVADLVNNFIDESDEEPATMAMAHRLLTETLLQRDDCDRILSRHAKNWDLARLALVDRNILRLAVCEMRGGETPLKVVIAEALKLAKEFSTAESPRFINGVLDAVMKEMQSDMGEETKE